jgi:hypothetical protein
MDVNAALEVGIGLVIMYLLLALLCTVFTEILSTVLAWRAKNLREGIEQLLDDPKLTDLKDAFFALPVISKAYTMAGKHGPSYMASKQFASGILEYLGKGGWPIGEGALKPADIEKAIAALPPSDTQRLLAAFAAETGGKLEDFRLRIAQWYDDSMERWGGNFKRKTQLWSFWIAAAIVVGVNADTFHVGVTLWNDPAARASVVALAPQIDVDDPKFGEIREKLRPFPLGWSQPAFGPAKSDAPSGGAAQADAGDWAWWIVVKIIGLAVSAFAVSLGAPFWFQILNKLNAIRGSGRKPAPAESA